MKAATVERATAAAAVVKAKVKAAFEKRKPKFAERITIAGEPVYLDMPEDSKVHADRIYLKKHYLPHDIITDETKTAFKQFAAVKKVASCDLNLVQKGLNYRLQTIEAEAAALSKERGDSVPLRQKLGHAQELRDLLEAAKADVLSCTNKELAARRAEEEAAALLAALDNRPPPVKESEIQMLVKKFAVLILHASDPQEKDRPTLNKPAKNLIQKLAALPITSIPPDVDTRISSPLLKHIFKLGSLGATEHDTVFKNEIYTELLEEIKKSLQANNELKNFIEALNKENPQKGPHQQIAAILSGVLNLLARSTEQVNKLTGEINVLTGKLAEAEKKLIPNPALTAEIEKLKADLSTVRQELENKKRELENAKLASEVIKAAARNKEAALTAKVAKLEKELAECSTKLPLLDAAVVAAKAETEAVRGELAAAEGKIAVATAAAAAAATGSAAAIAAAAAEAERQAAERAAAAEALRGKLAAAEARLLEANAALAAKTGDVERLTQEKAAVEATLGTERTEHTDIVAAMKRQIDEARVASGQAAASLAAANEELARIRAEKDACQKELDGDTVSGQEGLRAKLAALDKQDTEQKAKIKLLEEAAKIAATTLATKEQEALEHKAAIERLAQDMAKFKQEIESKKQELDAKILKLTADLGESRKETAAAAERLLAETARLQKEADANLKAKLAEQTRLNDANLREAMGKVAAAAAALAALQAQIAALDEEKKSLAGQVAAQAAADVKKNRKHTQELQEKEQECLARLGAAEAAAAAAKTEAAAASAATIKAAADAHKAEVAALTERVEKLQGQVREITVAKDAAIAAAEAAKNEAIDKIRTGAAAEKERLEAAVAESAAALRGAQVTAADSALQAKKAAEAAAAKYAADLAAAVSAAQKTCDEEKKAAAAAAADALANITQQVEGLRAQSQAQEKAHASELENLKTRHAAELAEAKQAAADDVKAAFQRESGDLKTKYDNMLAAELAAAKAASDAALVKELQKLSTTKDEERDNKIAELQRQSEAALVKARADAEEKSKRELAVANAALEARIAAAVTAAEAKITRELTERFEKEKSALMTKEAAAAATAAAVAAAGVVASKKETEKVAEARQTQKSEDLSTLKDFATHVLAGQAKWATYPGANAALATLLGKLDGRMNDTCALVYFVSYFLNTMVKPAIDNGRGTPQFQLITNIEDLIPKESEDSLFAFLMAIEPALLLANKVRLPGIETRKQAMTYFIKQNAPIQPLITFSGKLSKSVLDMEVAARVVRGVSPGDDDKNMTFFPDDGRIIFLYKPRGFDAATLMRYQEYSSGILNPVINTLSESDKQVVKGLSSTKEKVLTFDILFLSFILAAKRYILLRKLDPSFCSVPEEFDDITKGVPFVKSTAPAAPKPAAPAAAAQAPAAQAPAAAAKCTDVIFEPKYTQFAGNNILITLGDNHINYFKTYPFCFKEANHESLLKGSYYDYKFFQSQINNVIGKVCKGEINTTIFIQPGFRQDIHKTGSMVPINDPINKLYDMTSDNGTGNISFNCKERKTQEKMGPQIPVAAAAPQRPVAAPQESPAAVLQISNLVRKAEELRTGTAQERPISQAAQAEANRLLAAAAASSAGQSRRASAASIKKEANAAVATAKVATPDAWGIQGRGLVSNGQSAHMVLEDYSNSDLAPPARPASAAVAPPSSVSVAPNTCVTHVDINSVDGLHGVVLGTAVANVLKLFPFCFNVEGYSSIKTGINQKHYDEADLTRKINAKLGSISFKVTIPGFQIQGHKATMIRTGMIVPGSQFLFLKPTAGGRRTQKKRRQTSKKFTQRKR